MINFNYFFMFLNNLFANIEFYFEKTNFVMVASVFGAITNVGLNLLLMPKLGYLVAGYVTMLCYMLFAFAHYAFMRKVCKEKMEIKSVYNDKLILLISLVYLGCTALAMCLYNLIVIRYAMLFVAFVVVVIKREKVIEIVKSIKSKG